MKTFTKFTTGIVLLSSLSLLPGCSGKNGGESAAPAASSSMPKPYEIKSGIVRYKPLNIMGVMTTETLYFDDYGRREARETITETDIMGIKNYEHKMEIKDGKYAISYEIKKTENGRDITSREAARTDMSQMQEMAMAMGKMIDVKKMKEEMDYREEGTETVAGVTGTKYSVSMNKENPEARVYGVMYKNIAMKSQMMGMTIEAESIEQNAAFPASKFEVPSGYTIKDIDLAKEMERAGQGE